MFGGAHLAIPVGQGVVRRRGVARRVPRRSADDRDGAVKVGHAALTDGKLTFRGGISGGYHINDQFAVLAFVEVREGPVHHRGAGHGRTTIPLIPYEPVFTAGIGLSAQFGNSKNEAQFKGCAYTPEGCPAVETPIIVGHHGQRRRRSRQAASSARRSRSSSRTSRSIRSRPTRPASTCSRPSGSARKPRRPRASPRCIASTSRARAISVAVDGKKPGTATIAKLDEGSTTVPPIKLEPVLPPGQLRGVVHSLPSGKPVEQRDDHDLAGQTRRPRPRPTARSRSTSRRVRTRSRSRRRASRRRSSTSRSTPNGVAIKNIDLHK